jgi:hypothetical protein
MEVARLQQELEVLCRVNFLNSEADDNELQVGPDG